MAATLGTRLYSFISKSINTDTVFVSGLIARSSFPGSPARRHLSHLLTTVSIKYDRSPHCGNTAHQRITRLIYSPERITFQQLSSSIQWRHGPTWLNSPSKWPVWPHPELLLIQADYDEEVETPPVGPPLDETTKASNIEI